MIDVDENKPLINMTITDFANDETASRGNRRRINICMLWAMGVSAELWSQAYQHTKEGWDDRWKNFQI